MMKTNSQTTMGYAVKRVASGAVTYLAAYAVENEFVVSPSPCINGGVLQGKRPRTYVLPNAYSFTRKLTRHPKGWKVDYKGFPDEVLHTGYLSGIQSIAMTLTCPDQSNSVNNKALSKLYSEIKSSELNLATTVGEGRETLRMLHSVYSGAALLTDNLKKARRNMSRATVMGLRNPLQTVGGLALLLNLAIKPLIADVEAIRNHALSGKIDHIDMTASGRASAMSDLTSSTMVSGASVSQTRVRSQRIEYGLTYRITNLHDFENWRAGLTLRPTLAWELTTLSFLVDYFFKVGEYLELLESSILNNGITFMHGYKTVAEKDVWRGHSTKTVPFTTSGWLAAGHDISSSIEFTSKTRSVLYSFPMPIRPTVKLPKSGTQLINCAALLSQLISKR